jgi:hypothetical protein
VVLRKTDPRTEGSSDETPRRSESFGDSPRPETKKRLTFINFLIIKYWNYTKSCFITFKVPNQFMKYL